MGKNNPRNFKIAQTALKKKEAGSEFSEISDCTKRVNQVLKKCNSKLTKRKC